MKATYAYINPLKQWRPITLTIQLEELNELKELYARLAVLPERVILGVAANKRPAIWGRLAGLKTLCNELILKAEVILKAEDEDDSES